MQNSRRDFLFLIGDTLQGDVVGYACQISTLGSVSGKYKLYYGTFGACLLSLEASVLSRASRILRYAQVSRRQRKIVLDAIREDIVDYVWCRWDTRGLPLGNQWRAVEVFLDGELKEIEG